MFSQQSGDDISADSKSEGYPIVASVTIVTVCSVVILVTIVANLSVVVAFFKDKRLQTPSNYPLISLSLSDLLVGFFIFPCSLLYKLSGRWMLGRGVCVVWLCCDYMAISTSVFALIIITFDRYMTITTLQQQPPHARKKSTLWMIGIAWALPALTYIPITVAWPWIDTTFVPESGSCDEGWISFMPFVVPVTIFITYCPLLCLIFFNARIYLVIRKNAKSAERAEPARKPRGDDESAQVDDANLGTESTFAGKATAILALVKARKLLRRNNQMNKSSSANQVDEAEIAEKNALLERELQAKRINTFQSRMGNQRRLGPQNRGETGKMSSWAWWKHTLGRRRNKGASEKPGSGSSGGLGGLMLQQHQQGTIVFSTRNNNLLLDAVAASPSKQPSRISFQAAGGNSYTPGTYPAYMTPRNRIASEEDRIDSEVHMGSEHESSASYNEGRVPTSNQATSKREKSKLRKGGVVGKLISANQSRRQQSTSALGSTGDEDNATASSSEKVNKSGRQGHSGMGQGLGASGSGSGGQLSDGTRNRQLRRQQRNETIFKTIIVLVCVYIICCCPFSVITFLDLVSSISVSKYFWDTSVWFLYLSSALNPILYVYRNVPFKNAIRKIYRIQATKPSDNN